MTIRADSFALTPKLFGPVAQYALRGHGAELYADRSGNAHHLVAQITPGYAPDGYPDTCLFSGRVVGAVDAALQILGDLTLTVRAWARVGVGTRQFLNNENDGSAVASPYCMFLDSANRFCVATETANQIDHTYTSDLVAPWGRWALYSIRRNTAAGTWTLGINKTFRTSPPMIATVPLDGTQPKLYVGGPDVGSEVWLGASADKCIWDQYLTDAQVGGIVDAIGIK